MTDRSAHAVLQVADGIGALMEAWGFKRNMGRMWGLLYLEMKPLSAPEIGERLSLSSGAVSMLLAELTQWGAVKKTWVVGERREHFEAETSIWKMVSRVFQERELRWIETALDSFSNASHQLDEEPASDDPELRAKQLLLAQRVEGLVQLAHIGAHLLKSMLDGESIDSLPLKSIGELSSLVRQSLTQGENSDKKTK
jgi:HTH-type transcriptional regulator, glycine betaine synthesis regulator